MKLHVRSQERILVAATVALLASSPAGFTEDKPVSFYREVLPIFRQSCNGCHRPGKSKGQLDLTSHAAVLKGGKHGAAFVPQDATGSRLIEEVSGDEPAMPEEGEPLAPEEIALIERWIAEGGHDDTPPDAGLHRLHSPPTYRSLPSISAMAWSPAGDVLAVSGYHEVVLHSSDGSRVVGRLVGESPRIESVAFSTDGKWLAVSGGAPSEYGEIQIWDVAAQSLVRSIKTTAECVFGVSFSADNARVAVGCADKTVRVFAVEDGRELMKCDNHIDWVVATAFSLDGTRLITASRDKAVKLIDVSTGRLIDDVNRPREPMLSLARHPREELAVCGDEKGGIRLYKIAPRGGRLAEGDDKENSFVREFERLPGGVHSLAFSADGELIAAGSANGEGRIFKVSDGKRVATLKVPGNALFAVAFEPGGQQVAAGGEDGRVRVFDAKSGEPVRSFDGVPLSNRAVAARSLE